MFTQHGFDGVQHGPDRRRGRRVQAHRLQPLRRQGRVVRRRGASRIASSRCRRRCSSRRRPRRCASGCWTIARAFFAMISAPEAVAGHRMLCTPQMATLRPAASCSGRPARCASRATSPRCCERRIAAGELDIADVPRAAAQFFALLKGEPHACLVFGGAGPERGAKSRRTCAASVDLFLRAYACANRPAPRPVRCTRDAAAACRSAVRPLMQLPVLVTSGTQSHAPTPAILCAAPAPAR